MTESKREKDTGVCPYLAMTLDTGGVIFPIHHHANYLKLLHLQKKDISNEVNSNTFLKAIVVSRG